MAKDPGQTIPERPKVLFFSGKGGVGKTTLAGTAAVRMGALGSEVLIASTDPAHSLSDLFAAPIGRDGAIVAPRVQAVEVDAPAAVGDALEATTAGDTKRSGAGAAAADILKLASHAPGVDEIVSLDLLLRLLERAEHDAIVLDTAPTGHTLRLLALPELMDRYFGRLLKLRGQLSKIAKRLWRMGRKRGEEMGEPADLGEQLSGARGRMRMLGELLRDPSQCGLVLVTIAEAMSVLETSRTLELLQSQEMPVSAIMVNMVQPEQPGCPFCTARRAAHLEQLKGIRALAGPVPVVVVESRIEEPRGPDALFTLGNQVWSEVGDQVLWE